MNQGISAYQRLGDAVAAQPEDTRQRSRLVAALRMVDRFERLIKLRDADPVRFEVMTDSGLRIVLGNYEQMVRAFETEQAA